MITQLTSILFIYVSYFVYFRCSNAVWCQKTLKPEISQLENVANIKFLGTGKIWNFLDDLSLMILCDHNIIMRWMFWWEIWFWQDFMNLYNKTNFTSVLVSRVYTKILLLSETHRRPFGDPSETDMPDHRPVGDPLLHRRPIGDQHAP